MTVTITMMAMTMAAMCLLSTIGFFLGKDALASG